jgi:hypothetical protein
MAPSDARARTFVRILVAVGVTGLAGELALVAFVLRTGAWGRTTWERLLSETALVAVVYGMLLGLVVLVRIAPTFGFPPPPLRQSHQRFWMSTRLFRIFLALYTVPAIMQVTFLAFGWSTPLETASGLLHWYPISGMLVAGLVDAHTVFRWGTASHQSA